MSYVDNIVSSVTTAGRNIDDVKTVIKGAGNVADTVDANSIKKVADAFDSIDTSTFKQAMKGLINSTDLSTIAKVFNKIEPDDAIKLFKKLDPADRVKLLISMSDDAFRKLPLNKLDELADGMSDDLKKQVVQKIVKNADESPSYFRQVTDFAKSTDQALGGGLSTILKYSLYAGAAIGGVYLATFVGRDLADEIWNDDEVTAQRRDCLAQCMPRYYDKYLEDEIDLDDLKTPSGSLLSGGKGVQCFPDSCFPSDNRLSVENDGVAPPNRPPMDKYCTPNTINSCQATCKQACEDTYQTTIEDLGDAASSALVGTASSVGDAAGGFLGGIFGGAFDGMEWAFYVSVGVSVLVLFLVVYLMFR